MVVTVPNRLHCVTNNCLQAANAKLLSSCVLIYKNMRSILGADMKKEKSMERLLKPEEAAEVLGLKLGTIYKFSMAGKLPATKVGGALRFSEQKLQEYIDSRTNKVGVK